MDHLDAHDYTIEVCQDCGAQLDRYGNGRCPVDQSHWSSGGMIVHVLARPDSEQDKWYKSSRVPDGVKA